MLLLGIIGFILLVFLPGAWVTFGLRLKGMPFGVRLLTGAVLSPLVVAVQFYILRLLGAPFELTSLLLVAVNLPALLLMARYRPRLVIPDKQALAAGGLIIAIIIICIGPFLVDLQKLLYTWEAWSQADVVYSLANGGLDLQDAELAGVRLSYPWAGHVYQAVQSYLLDAPPVTSYIWGNLVWLLLIFAFTSEIVAVLGGSRLAQITAALWLSFGVNVVGLSVGPALPAALGKYHPLLAAIWGDNRYSPWLDKLVFFGQMYFAMGLFIAILYLMLRPWPSFSLRDYVVLTGLLLIGLSVVYPVLLPPAAAVVGARGLVTLLRLAPTRPPIRCAEIVGLGVALVLVGILTLGEVKFLTQGRASATVVSFHPWELVRENALTSIVVTSPLLLAFVLYIRRFWREKSHALIVLGLGTLASLVLYVVFDIPWWRNEYKFVFTAAICLAPFPSIMLDSVFQRLRRFTLPAIALLGVVLAAPFAEHTYRETYALYTLPGPLVDVQHFDLSLASSERLAGLTDAIREQTPIDSLLVLEDNEIYFPTLTRRQLYVAPAQTQPHPGILVTSDDMLTLVKGYPRALVDERRSTVRSLFDSNEAFQRSQALDRLLSFNRPLALVLDIAHQGNLIQWLTETHLGRAIYRDSGMTLWLIQPGAQPLAGIPQSRE